MSLKRAASQADPARAERRRHRKRVARRYYVLVGVGLVAAAVATELRKPADQRTWQGHIGGVVPYSFRLPEPDEVRRTLWDPDSDRLLVPRSFGVGWSVNFGAVARYVRRAVSGRRFRKR